MTSLRLLPVALFAPSASHAAPLNLGDYLSSTITTKAWNTKGWFWKPVDAAKERIKAQEFDTLK